MIGNIPEPHYAWTRPVPNDRLPAYLAYYFSQIMYRGGGRIDYDSDTDCLILYIAPTNAHRALAGPEGEEIAELWIGLSRPTGG